MSKFKRATISVMMSGDFIRPGDSVTVSPGLHGDCIKVEEIPDEPENVTKGFRGMSELASWLAHQIIEVVSLAGLKTPRRFDMPHGDVVVTLDGDNPDVVILRPTPPTPDPLKPCPFCGGEATMGNVAWTVSCENKRCSVSPRVGFVGDPMRARAAWNRRTT